MTIKIDLGCGGAKRPGYIGLDYIDAPGVDHVLDLTAEPFPFADDSVDEVYSAHFLEHVTVPNNVLMEIGRVCKDGAHIQIWTPYAFSNEAFFYGHTAYLTETVWYQWCVSHHREAAPLLGGRWLLDSVTFIVNPNVQGELQSHGVPIDFAIKYHKGVVEEFGVDLTYRADLDAPGVEPKRLWSHTRFGEANLLVPGGGEPGVAAPPTTLTQRLKRWVPEPMKPALRSLRRH